MDEIKALWNWSPGLALSDADLSRIGQWKQGLYLPVVERLLDREPESRLAAVTCLGNLPLDQQAAPAAKLINDKDVRVKVQVLVSFGQRSAILPEEDILPLLHDNFNPAVPDLARRILKGRGLSDELISLGRQVYDPNPAKRIAAIPSLKDRTDIDPTVWLLFLSRDTDESVRLTSLNALAGREQPEVRERMAEMAKFDASKAVKQKAQALLISSRDSTVENLPPLPTTTGLKMKAN